MSKPAVESKKVDEKSLKQWLKAKTFLRKIISQWLNPAVERKKVADNF